MQFPIPALLGIAYGLSEAGLALLKRSRDDSVDADDRSLLTLWITIIFSVTAGIAASYLLPQAAIGGGRALFWSGAVLFAAGLALRWYSIVYLGRFFTVNVGAIAAFAGLAACLDNWISMVVIVLPIFAAFSHRITIEETALSSALGSPYTKYMRRTRRLLPFVY